MLRKFEYDYNRSPEALVALLSDPAFLRSRCEASGDVNVEVNVEQTSDGFRLLIVREREVSLPSFAKHVFKPRNRVTDRSEWRREGAGWIADYAIHIRGVPGETRGRTVITPSADGCHYESSFEVMASVAIFRNRVESFIADRIEESLRAGAERNAALLSS